MSEESGQRISASGGWRRSGHLIAAIVLFVATALVAILIAVAHYSKKDEALEPAAVPPLDVTVVTVAATPTIIDYLELPATVEANRVVTVSAEVAGRVESVEIKEGSACKVGAVIARLNTDLLQADYDGAAARAALDKATLKRVTSLKLDGAATPQELDQATAAAAASRSAVASCRARLDRASIAAPLAGVLNELHVEKGEYVLPGTAVAQLVDMKTAKIVVNVPELDVGYLKVGGEATIEIGLRGQSRSRAATISYIGEIADPGTRTTRVEMTADNGDRTLRSGQIVRVKLVRRVITGAIMIPLEEVIPFENSRAVYVVRDGVAERVEVTLGMIRGREVQVTGGLEPGDRLIVAGHRFAAPGQPVNLPKGD